MNNELKIVTWNLGYGVYPDYYSITGRQDSFRNAIPVSKKEVKKNIDGQIKILKQIAADIMFLQEVSTQNPVNLWTNQVLSLKKAFPDYSNSFIPSVKVPGILVVGKCTLVKGEAYSKSIEKYFKALTKWDNFIMRNKMSILTRMPFMESELVTLNIHLAPFERQSELREKQLRYIFDIAKAECELGNYVIIGGDWNMDMPLTEVPPKYKSIGTALPNDLEEEFRTLNWRLAVAKEATIRDLKSPYPDTDMSNIDGFLCSPNLEMLDIEAIQDFRYSDHCPVVLKLRAK